MPEEGPVDVSGGLNIGASLGLRLLEDEACDSFLSLLDRRELLGRREWECRALGVPEGDCGVLGMPLPQSTTLQEFKTRKGTHAKSRWGSSLR
jgi:hypothetical protein